MSLEIRRYMAVVTSTEDPDKLGRIKVLCPDFLGATAELPDWIDPVFDWGWYYTPDVNELVEIEVLVSTPRDDSPLQSSLTPRIWWRGKRFFGGEKTNAPRPVPSVFTGNRTSRGFQTPQGHFILFDDAPSGPRVTLKWFSVKDDPSKFSLLDFAPDGSVLVQSMAGSKVELKVDGSILISGSPKVTLTAGTKIELGAGTLEKVIKGETFKTLFVGHKHPTAMGPSGTPIPGDPIPIDDCLSSKVVTE